MESEKVELVSEKRVRSALSYLLHAIVNLHNEYGAAGAWAGIPVPLHEISLRVDLAESLLLNGPEYTVEKFREMGLEKYVEEYEVSQKIRKVI